MLLEVRKPRLSHLKKEKDAVREVLNLQAAVLFCFIFLRVQSQHRKVVPF